MATDAEIKIKGFRALHAELGSVGMEKFISLLIRDPFDYTYWQRELWKELSVEDLSNLAMKQRKDNK